MSTKLKQSALDQSSLHTICLVYVLRVCFFSSSLDHAQSEFSVKSIKIVLGIIFAFRIDLSEGSIFLIESDEKDKTEAVNTFHTDNVALTINQVKGTISIPTTSLGNADLSAKLLLSLKIFISAIIISIIAKIKYTIFETIIHISWITALSQKISQNVQSGDKSHQINITSGCVINVMIKITQLSKSTAQSTAF